MLNKIINAITQGLYNEFGEGYRYYAEDIPQNVKTPCFTVRPIDYIQRSRNALEYEVSVPLVIEFFPKEDVNSKKGNFSIANRTQLALEYITLENGKMLRCDKSTFNPNNDIMQIFVTYNFYLRKIEQVELMQEMSKKILSKQE